MAEADIKRVCEELAASVKGGKHECCCRCAHAGRAVPTARVPAGAVKTPADLAPYIDHTILKADATVDDVRRVAREARENGFATVCVNSCMVRAAAEVLAGCPTVPIAVVGFPLGAALTSSKAFESRESVAAGAKEIDMVIAVGALKARDYAYVLADIAAVVEASKPYPVKVIIETCLLSQDEKIAACVLSKAAGATFVKTSTGFSTHGATAEDIALMRKIVGDEVGVKASGGVRTADDALRMINAGANRIGASASVAIIKSEFASAK
eukprot:TRINITY_DN264_c0_g1_i1.p1 TRINITY_DN264_c0_g1~~TRINITY_DN264_c0_g1_i1.p1  ORF type:complete len:280 (+),score=89.64 TRINITY_DN264_c0_g1_i1:37-840(+)